MSLLSIIKSITVEPIAFLFIMSVFAEYTSFQDLLFTKNCLKLLNTTDISLCDKRNNRIADDVMKEIDSETAHYLLYYNGILYFSAIISSCIAGVWSDEYGRLIPMSVPSAFSIISEILFIICSLYINNNVIPLMMICALLSGISGGSTSLLTNVFGFISDVTNDDNRTKRITIVESCFFCGGFIGYSMTAFLLKNIEHNKHISVFSIILCIHIIILVYITQRLRKVTVNRYRLLRFSEICAPKTFVNLFVGVFRTVFKRRQNNYRCKILILLIISVLTFYGMVVQITVLYVYVRRKPLNWDTSMYGYFSGIQFAISGIALCSLPLAFRCHSKLKDTTIAMIGLLSRTFGLMMMGFATNTWQMFLCPILMVFSEYPLPSMRSMLSKLVESDEKGKIFAFFASLQNICFFTGGIAFTKLFKNAVTNDTFMGLSFEIAASFQIIAFALFAFIHFKMKPLTASDNDTSNINTEVNDNSEDDALLDH